MDTTNREIAVRASGAALGGAIGGPVGAAIGVVTGDMLNRALSEWEQRRVVSVAELAAQEIEDRRAVESLRPGWADGSSTYHEVVENVLLKAQREPEEKKLPYMAYLLANLAFDSSIDVATAHKLINDYERLTYQHFCILKLSWLVQTGEKQLYSGEATHLFGIVPEDRHLFLRTVLESIHRLGSEGYIRINNVMLTPVGGIKPNTLTIEHNGAILANLLRLHLIPDSDMDEIASVLRVDS